MNLVTVRVIVQNGYVKNCDQAITCENTSPKSVSLKKCGTCGDLKYNVVAYSPLDTTLLHGVDVYGNATLIISGTLAEWQEKCNECCGQPLVVAPSPDPIIPPSSTAPFLYCITTVEESAIANSSQGASFFTQRYLNKGVFASSLFNHNTTTKVSKYNVQSTSQITSFIGGDTAVVGACV